MLAHFPGPEGSAGHEFDIVGTTNLDTSDVDVGGDHHENALSQSDAALALVEPGVQNPESASRDPLFFVPWNVNIICSAEDFKLVMNPNKTDPHNPRWELRRTWNVGSYWNNI